MKTRIFIFLNFLCLIGYSQKITKQKLNSFFKKSIQQESKSTITSLSNPWLICNEDSAYFLKDTISLYNGNYLPKCCNFIAWTFYKKNKFVECSYWNCEARSSVSKIDDFYEVNIISKKKEIILRISNPNLQTKLYKVIDSIEIKDSKSVTTKITLIRI